MPRRTLIAMVLPGVLCASALGQAGAPIPDVPTLMQQVTDRQRQMDTTREDYTYREMQTVQELNKDGSTKKTESSEFNVFYVNTHELQRLVKKNGKELTADEEKKEEGRITKEIEKAEKTPPGYAPDADTISVSRLLSIMKVSNARRIALDGRSTIAFDFTGDPHAKTHGRMENLSKKLSGTLWIDEKDREVRRVTARIDDNFHMGFGMMSVDKDSNFTFDATPVKGGLWLPTGAEVHLVAHALGLIGYRANIHVADSDYEKFHAEAQQQPGAKAAKQ